MLTTLLLSASALTGTPNVTWTAPSRFISGSAYRVSVEIEAPSDGTPVANWLMTPAAFTMNGKPLMERENQGTIQVAAGAMISLSFDLAPAIDASGDLNGANFKLGLDKAFSAAEELEVVVCKQAPKGLNFLEMPVEQLSNYQVVLETNRGDMVLEFWPEAAPNHVRNYLELAYTGFYDGLTFHRVIPGFMIQGGCPDGTGSGNGPRRIEAEFSTDEKFKHVPGVLSAARTADPNSASCQFFVMHANAPHLDGQYSAFGKLIEGLEVVERVVLTPTNTGARPTEKQYIRSAIVIQAN